MSVLATFEAIGDGVWGNWRPTPRVPCLAWMRENVRMPNGAPFDVDMYPHIGAPGGPAEAFDNPHVRAIWLMWATRLGKTAFGLSLQLYIAAIMPAAMMFATSTKDIAHSIVETKIHEMYARCRPLAAQQLPKHRRNGGWVHYRDCRAVIAWSGSPSTLADKSIWFLHLNEIDKWDKNKGSEGDAADLAMERTKEFPTRKILGEGTPTTKNESRINPRFLTSTQRRYFVPCPRCKKYQLLRFGERPDENGRPVPGGITWDHLADGSSDPNLAEQTARYVCEHCRKELHDEDRAGMLKGGRWAAKGQYVDRAGRVKGIAAVQGSEEGFQLGSIYARSLGWGDVAKAIVNAKTPKKRQNLINSWAGEVYERRSVRATWQEVAGRLGSENGLGIIPAGGIFIARGVDRQIDHWVHFAMAFGEKARHWLIDYGTCNTDDEMAETIARTFPRADGGDAITGSITFVDSGDQTDDVYKFCARVHNPAVRQFCFPIKGVDTDMGGEPYTKKVLGEDKKTVRRAGLTSAALYRIKRDYWEEVTDAALAVRDHAMYGALILPAEAAGDQDLIEQLLNGVEIDGVWQKADEELPDDFRAAYRYGRCAAEVIVKRKWMRVHYHPPADAKPVKPVRGTGPKTGDVVQSSNWLNREGIRS